MTRRVMWFSAGAASAVAAKLTDSDIIAYCETGSEDIDNARFLADCEIWFGRPITRLRGKYQNTWEVWKKRKYISGINGAPCTAALKVAPRLEFQQDGDINIFGYTYDKRDIIRAEGMRDAYPEMKIETPLIDRKLTKAACLSLLKNAGVKPPRVYALGFPNANCIPCCKATSPSYWALVRKEYPLEFKLMADLSREMNVKLTRIKGERIFIDQIPEGHATTQPLAPECDFLCSLADEEINQ